jgi:hypothetical protein
MDWKASMLGSEGKHACMLAGRNVEAEAPTNQMNTPKMAESVNQDRLLRVPSPLHGERPLPR